MIFFAGFGNINCLAKCITNSQRKKYKQKEDVLFQFAFFNGYINKINRSIPVCLNTGLFFIKEIKSNITHS